MIVWSGRGFLCLVVLGVLFIFSVKVLPDEFGDYAFVISFFLTGIFSWIYGVKWNNENERNVVDEKTGQRIGARNSHTLFWIPMQYWGIIFPLFGVGILFQNSVIAGMISSLLFGVLAYGLFFRKEKIDNNIVFDKISIDNANSEKSKYKTRSTDKPLLKEKIIEENKNKLEEKLQRPKMTQEEIEAYHKRYMPK